MDFPSQRTVYPCDIFKIESTFYSLHLIHSDFNNEAIICAYDCDGYKFSVYVVLKGGDVSISFLFFFSLEVEKV